tara:strand:+ start:775 stop:1023 length:249 start_codon:yes stop_codon:yes gene_type:complete
MSDELKKAKEKLKETRARYNETKSQEDFMANKAAADKVQLLKRKIEGPSFIEKVLTKGIKLYNQGKEKYSNIPRKPTKNPLD